jgi:hypothetical protein
VGDDFQSVDGMCQRREHKRKAGGTREREEGARPFAYSAAPEEEEEYLIKREKTIEAHRTSAAHSSPKYGDYTYCLVV